MKQKILLFCFIFLSASLISLWGDEKKEEKKEDKFTKNMSKEHEKDKPDASPSSKKDPKKEVEGEKVVYGKLGDQGITGYLAYPKGQKENLPALIVIHEWWGLNSNIESMARRFAGEGYIALAVDLYNNKSASTPQEARKLMSEAMKNQSLSEENLKLAYAYLKKEKKATKVGSVGWCFGGFHSLKTALILPGKLNACVMYYGWMVMEKEKLEKLDMPIMGLFGGLDQGIPVKMVKEFEKLLKDLKKDFTLHIYEDADHAFANPSGTRYNAKAAEDAWEKTLAFFKKHLKK